MRAHVGLRHLLKKRLDEAARKAGWSNRLDRWQIWRGQAYAIKETRALLTRRLTAALCSEFPKDPNFGSKCGRRSSVEDDPRSAQHWETRTRTTDAPLVTGHRDSAMRTKWMRASDKPRQRCQQADNARLQDRPSTGPIHDRSFATTLHTDAEIETSRRRPSRMPRDPREGPRSAFARRPIGCSAARLDLDVDFGHIRRSWRASRSEQRPEAITRRSRHVPARGRFLTKHGAEVMHEDVNGLLVHRWGDANGTLSLTARATAYPWNAAGLVEATCRRCR